MLWRRESVPAAELRSSISPGQLKEPRMKTPKVMLVCPPRTILRSSVKRCCTPIGLAYVAAVLEKNEVEVQVLDAFAEGYDTEEDVGGGYVKVGLSAVDIQQRISAFSPDFVGVTCAFTSEIGNATDVCRLVKKQDPRISVVLGGLHPTNYPLETLAMCPEIDFIILGEGEFRMLKLVRGERDFDGLVDGKTHTVNLPRTRIENLDELPFPARHLLKMDLYLKINKHISPYPRKQRTEQILTSRGCPGQCVFCTSSRFWGAKFRKRSPENVIEEMKYLIKEYGVEEFQFTDDSMTLDRARAMRIFEMMEPLDVIFCMANGTFVNSLDEELIRHMRRAGCYQITFSVESGSKRSLELMRKHVNLDRVKPLVRCSQRLGISCHATFVLGIPGEAPEDIRASFRFAANCDFDSASFFVVSPLPGSELYDLCVQQNYLTDTSFDKMDFKSAKINNPSLPPLLLERLIINQNTLFIVKYLVRHPVKFFRKYGLFMLNNPREIPKVFGRVT